MLLAGNIPHHLITKDNTQNEGERMEKTFHDNNSRKLDKANFNKMVKSEKGKRKALYYIMTNSTICDYSKYICIKCQDTQLFKQLLMGL